MRGYPLLDRSGCCHPGGRARERNGPHQVQSRLVSLQAASVVAWCLRLRRRRRRRFDRPPGIRSMNRQRTLTGRPPRAITLGQLGRRPDDIGRALPLPRHPPSPMTPRYRRRPPEPLPPRAALPLPSWSRTTLPAWTTQVPPWRPLRLPSRQWRPPRRQPLRSPRPAARGERQQPSARPRATLRAHAAVRERLVLVRHVASPRGKATR